MNINYYEDINNYNEAKLFAEKLQVWLGLYTNEVIEKVLTEKLPDILNNSASLKLIDELYERTLKERNDEMFSFRAFLASKNHDCPMVHLHPITHSGSYRDVLYDLYIRDI